MPAKKQTSFVPKGEVSKIVSKDGTPLVDERGNPGFLSRPEIENVVREVLRTDLQPLLEDSVMKPIRAQGVRTDQIYEVLVKIQEGQTVAERHASNASSTANLTNYMMLGKGVPGDMGAIGRLEDRVEAHEKQIEARLEAQDKVIKTAVDQGKESLANQQEMVHILQNVWGWLQQPGSDGKTKRIKTGWKWIRRSVAFFAIGGGGASLYDHAGRIMGALKAATHIVTQGMTNKK